ncbi:MAG: ferritin-like domain-containing protein [Polyangia bacterium]
MRREWAQRVEVEYRSAAVTQQLGLWLTQLGASPDLIRAALRIAADELDHAQRSHRVAVAAGSEAHVIDRASLMLEDGDLERVVTQTALGTFCLGESVAVPLFAAMRRGCTVAVARRALDRILIDEVRHRAFGWTLLGWLLEHVPGTRVIVEGTLPRSFAALRRTYVATDSAATDDERAWGLIAPREYAPILAKTFERDYVPSFAALGIDAGAAWG